MDGETHHCTKSGRRAGSVGVTARDNSASVQVRYVNAYRAATITITFGIIVQIVGAAAAALALLVSLGVVAQNQSTGSLALGAFSGLTGIVIGIALGLFGTFIRAQGELLRATLDTAVNSSPFLTTDQKGEAMGLK
jgi:uncharacterized YccA/Bax inhibitor family protein